jgi:hypothetical protein
MYMAWLCYPHTYDLDDLDDNEPEIKFEEPESYLYAKILPIQFNILHKWDDHKRPKNTRLYP